MSAVLFSLNGNGRQRTSQFNSYFLALALASSAARLYDNAVDLDAACVYVSICLLYNEQFFICLLCNEQVHKEGSCRRSQK